MNDMIATQEIGSLKKPSWRLLAYRGERITSEALKEAKSWGKKLNVEGYSELIKILREPDSPGRREAGLDWSVKYALRFFESTGLDRVYTGEQARVEMYEHFARRVGNFEMMGIVNSLDFAYYNKGAVVGRPEWKETIYLKEFRLAKRFAKLPLKVPITGPYTMVDWSFNEYYEGRLRQSVRDWKKARLYDLKMSSRRDFLLDLVDLVYRKEIKALVDDGAEWIQVDEPALTTHPSKEEMKLFVEAWNRMVHGFSCKFSLHNCYSNYRVLAEYASELNGCSQLALEFANRDGIGLGVGEESRPGYSELKSFVDNGYDGEFGLGVLHVHRYEGEDSKYARVVDGFLVESPQLVRDRVLYACKLVGAGRILGNPDCGGRRLPWEVYYKKLENLVEGVRMASKVTGA